MPDPDQPLPAAVVRPGERSGDTRGTETLADAGEKKAGTRPAVLH